MMLVPITKLKEFFNIKHLMELFRVSAILEKIKNFKFFLDDAEIEIVKEDDVFWFSRAVKAGVVVKTLLNEMTVKVVKILQMDYFSLLGIKPKKTKSESGHKQEGVDTTATKVAFATLVSAVFGWRMYSTFKK